MVLSLSIAVRTLLLVNGMFDVDPSGPKNKRFGMDIKVDHEVTGMRSTLVLHLLTSVS